MEKIAALLLVLASLQGITLAVIKLDVEPSGTQTVLPGQEFTFKCMAGVKLQYCKIVSGSDTFNMGPLIQHQKYVYEGDGLEKGHCGVRILNVEDKNNGPLKCEVAFPSEPSISTGTINLIVARPPREKPDLIVVNAADSQRRTRYRENETINATCIVKDSRPAPKIQWYIGDKEITRDLSRVETTSGPEGNVTVQQSLTFKVKKEHNNQNLVCVATHIALSSPMNTSFQAEVLFPPSNDNVYQRHLYGYKVGKKENITVEVPANPEPNCKWEVDNVQIYNRWNSDNHYRAMPVTKKSPGVWECMLEITQVEEGDIAKTYILRVSNELGNTSFKFALSKSEQPDEVEMSEFGAGTIIGIVVAVLFLLIVIFLVIFARATGRWCFSGGVPARADIKESEKFLQDANKGEQDTSNEKTHLSRNSAKGPESSDTESADHGPSAEKAKTKPRISLSYLLKKKKDRVAADVEDVKVQNVEDKKDAEKAVVSPQNVNKGPTAGGDVVYAELDLQASQRPAGRPVVRKEEEKTEYAEIIHTK